MANIASTTSSVGSAMWQQVQSQQAQRAADAAAQTALALQSQARSARGVAQRAQDSARAIEIQANQAQAEAARANLNVNLSRTVGEMQTRLDDLYTKLPQMVTRSSSTPLPATPVTVVSTTSTETSVGTVIDTSA